MNPNLEGLIGTGTKWKDALIGGGTGLGEALNGGDGRYYVNAQWQGNGLAKSGLGYAHNPNRRDYTSGGVGLADVFRNRNNQNQNGNLLSSLGSIAPYINKFVNAQEPSLYNNGYAMLDNNYSSPISSVITDMFNADTAGTPYGGEFGSVLGSLGDYIGGSGGGTSIPTSIFQ